MWERQRFDRELADLGLREYQVGPLATPPTIGFEFDVHFGLIREVVTDAHKAMPADGDRITDHTDAADGFRVKRDGPRLEIATKPFTVDSAGKADLDTTIAKILKFGSELRDGCKGASTAAIVVAGVSGRPRPFTHARTIISALPIVRLPFEKKFHPKNCSVWASPQATITIPLSKVAALVAEIKKSEGKGAGVALTGSAKQRMGLRSEALYKALNAVQKTRREIVSKRPRLVLSNGTEVDATSFSEDLSGFLILLVSYLWSGELRYDFAGPKPGDYEPFAKAYLPVNVKAPFSEIFKKLLTPADQFLFKEVFAVGSARERLFRLAKPGATKADGTKKLFPPGRKEGGLDSVYERQKAKFGSVPTWDDLVEHTLDPTHKGWGDQLLVPLSKIIGIDRTKPRVALELRRIGFNAVFAHQWKGLMDQIFTMTKMLNT